eukprot:gene2223-biopygen11361
MSRGGCGGMISLSLALSISEEGKEESMNTVLGRTPLSPFDKNNTAQAFPATDGGLASGYGIALVNEIINLGIREQRKSVNKFVDPSV